VFFPTSGCGAIPSSIPLSWIPLRSSHRFCPHVSVFVPISVSLPSPSIIDPFHPCFFLFFFYHGFGTSPTTPPSEPPQSPVSSRRLSLYAVCPESHPALPLFAFYLFGGPCASTFLFRFHLSPDPPSIAFPPVPYAAFNPHSRLLIFPPHSPLPILLCQQDHLPTSSRDAIYLLCRPDSPFPPRYPPSLTPIPPCFLTFDLSTIPLRSLAGAPQKTPWISPIAGHTFFCLLFVRAFWGFCFLLHFAAAFLRAGSSVFVWAGVLDLFLGTEHAPPTVSMSPLCPKRRNARVGSSRVNQICRAVGSPFGKRHVFTGLVASVRSLCGNVTTPE